MNRKDLVTFTIILLIFAAAILVLCTLKPMLPTLLTALPKGGF